MADGPAAEGPEYAARIGEEPFRALLRHPATRDVPLVIETLGGPVGHAAGIKRLKALRDG